MLSDAFSTAVMIGGPAGSGKSTIARLLARKRGLRWYSTDAHGWNHRARAVAQGLHDEHDPTPGNFDRGALIAADLGRLAHTAPTVGTIVEGALITLEFAPLSRSVWLMPSPAEQRRRLINRSGTTAIHDGLIDGHRLITGQLTGSAATIVDVDGQTIDETLAVVETVLGPALNDLPSAHTRTERQQVIRYGNRSLVDQLQVSIASGRIDPTDQHAQRTFDCECGLPDCRATVHVVPADAIRLANGLPGAFRAAKHRTG